MHAEAVGPGRWLLGGNWDETLWGGELPSAAWIDAATPHTPVFLSRMDSHMALANTMAVNLAGITAGTPDPAGGVIGRCVGAYAGAGKGLEGSRVFGHKLTPCTSDPETPHPAPTPSPSP